MSRIAYLATALATAMAFAGCGSPPEGAAAKEAGAIAASNPNSGLPPVMSEVHGLPQPIVSWRNALPEPAAFDDSSPLVPIAGGYTQRVVIKRQSASGATARETWLFTLKGGQIENSRRVD